MSDEEQTPSKLEELKKQAIREGELEEERQKTDATKLQEEEKERLEFRRESKGMVLTDIDLPFSKVLWLTVQFFLAGIIVVIPIYFIVFLIMFS